jgi:hypothetical protein
MIFTTTNGVDFEISPEEADFVSKYTWSYDKGYIRCQCRPFARVALSRLIAYRMGLNCQGSICFLDRNPLNLHRNNIRPGTKSKIGGKRKLNSNNTSGIKGVSWMANRQRWQVSIKADGKSRFLGLFENKEEAAEAYARAAEKYFGEFANPVRSST